MTLSFTRISHGVARAAATACTAWTAALLAGCMSPQPPHGMPDVSVIGFAPDGDGRAIPPSCESLNQPSGMVDAGMARPGIAFGCATYSNLAAMIARPADLVDPRPYAGAAASTAIDAVRRHEEGRLAPFESPATTTVAPGASPAGSRRPQ